MLMLAWMALPLMTVELMPLCIILINLKSDEPMIAVCCGGNMPDPAEFIDMDSHHPESAALYAALCFVQELLACFPCGPFTDDLSPL